MHCMQTYLSSEEFREKFGMGKDAFYKLPKWKQNKLKMALQLFWVSFIPSLFSKTPCSLNCRWKKACSQICTYSFLTKVSLKLSLVKLIQHSNCCTSICSGGTHSQEYKGQHQCIFSCFCSQEACFLDKWTQPEIFSPTFSSPPPPLFFWWFECLALYLCWVSCLVFFLVTGLLWACIFVHLHFLFLFYWEKNSNWFSVEQ